MISVTYGTVLRGHGRSCSRSGRGFGEGGRSGQGWVRGHTVADENQTWRKRENGGGGGEMARPCCGWLWACAYLQSSFLRRGHPSLDAHVEEFTVMEL